MSEPDVHNFSSSSSHRLPTVSASQALLRLDSVQSRALSTSLSTLDAALQASSSTASTGNAPRGVSRGHVTEVYGPPASGKTCFGMQLATNALHAGDRVVWVDTASPLPGPRFKEILSSQTLPISSPPPSSPPIPQPLDSLLNAFTSIQAPSLPHLLSLFAHPPQHFPPERTGLIIIDSVSALFAAAYPKSSEAGFRARQNDTKRKDSFEWAANRRWGVAGELLSKLGKMAAARDLAVVVINQTTTRLRRMAGAMLGCAISGNTWDAGIYSRIVLYRDLVSDSAVPEAHKSRELRFAAVLKAAGKAVDDTSAPEKVAPFVIASSGLQAASIAPEVKSSPPHLSTNRPKRKRDEIADSEDEEEFVDSEEEYGPLDEILAALEEQEEAAAAAAADEEHAADGAPYGPI